MLDDFAGDGEPHPLAGTQRICPLAAVENGPTLALRDTRAIVFHQNVQMAVGGLAHGNFHELQTVLTGVIENVTHHFHKIVLLADKADLRRNIERNIDPFALVHLIQGGGQAVEQGSNWVQLPAQQGTAAAHAGAMQIVANLLRDSAYLLQHHRFRLVDADLFTAQRAQGALHHRQRRFQAMGEIGEGGAVFVIAFALAANQAVKVADQPGQLAGGVGVEFFAVMLFQFAHLFCQRLDRPQAPPGGDPQQGDHQQQVGGQHVDKPAPHHIAALELHRNGIDHHNAELGHFAGGRVEVDRHRVGHLRIVALLADGVQLFLNLMVIAQQHTAAVDIGFNLMEAIAFQPFRLNAFRQPGNITLRPQQFALLIVDKGHRRAFHIQVFRDIDVNSAVFPSRQHIKEIALAAQQAKGGFIEANAIAHQGHHAVGQGEHQHHPGGRQQEANP